MTIPVKPLIIRASELEQWHARERMLSDAEEQARIILEKARQEADALQESSRNQARIAYEKGYDSGRSDGEVEAAKQLSQTSARLQNYLDGLESRVADMCLSVVHHIMGEFNEIDILQKCIQQALKDFQNTTSVTVRVAPEYVVAIRNGIREAKSAMLTLPNIEGDAALSPEQCLLVSMDTIVEIGPYAQLAVLGTALGSSQEQSDE